MQPQTYSTHCGKTIFIQRKNGLKRLTLRFSKKQEAFVVSAAPFVPLKEITRFIDSANGWFLKIDSHLSKNQPKLLAPGDTILLLGKSVRIDFIPNCKETVILKENVLEVLGVRSKFEHILVSFLRKIASQKFSHYSEMYAKNLGVRYTKITIKDMKTRYGSCSSVGHLNYCWRVVMAPEAVLAYLCAHEVSHLKEMNHSKAFWKNVQDLCPDFKVHKKWLKLHGKELISVKFG